MPGSSTQRDRSGIGWRFEWEGALAPLRLCQRLMSPEFHHLTKGRDKGRGDMSNNTWTLILAAAGLVVNGTGLGSWQFKLLWREHRRLEHGRPKQARPFSGVRNLRFILAHRHKVTLSGWLEAGGGPGPASANVAVDIEAGYRVACSTQRRNAVARAHSRHSSCAPVPGTRSLRGSHTTSASHALLVA
ncbi:hypothetical protein GCM10023203_37710 [Actinomycetospora straminea]|uniref:DDE family transposase n=1 Tax=Actinomycetospora straminea TaxID=663607 RepID=A0ABP9EPX5_9PSEU